MTHDDRHPGEELSAYADGELPPAEADAVESHLASCTECRRELAAIRAVGDAMSAGGTEETGSVWGAVRRRIVEPAGWLLLGAGVAVLAALAGVEWFRTGSLTVEWLAATAVGVGVGLLALSIGREQYREWKQSPYRDVER